MIIGRTNIFAERKSNKNNLTKKQYYYISHLSRDFIIKNKLSSLPINLEIILKHNDWNLVKYSKLKQLGIGEYELLMDKSLGFVELTPNNQYIIFYNDSLPKNIQRYTIAHEIGHIILNHFSAPIENREQEANMFATRLLMPMCVIHECKVSSAKELSKLCEVSEISANYRYNRLELVKKRNKFYTDPNEEKVKVQFESFINFYKKCNNKTP